MNYPTNEYLTFMARTSLQNQESPNQENNQLLEDLLQRLNSLEINIREVTHENQQLRRTNSSLESRLEIIERRVSESERQQPNQDIQQRREQRVYSPEDLRAGDLIRIINSSNPRETFAIVQQTTTDRVYFRFNGSGQSTWCIYSNIVKVQEE